MTLFQSKVFITVEEATEKGFFSKTPPPNTNLKVFDCRFSLDDPLNYGRKEYLKGHLPNAIFVDLDTELSGDLTKTTARHPLPVEDDFIALCVKAGLVIPKSKSSSAAEGTAAPPPQTTACLCYDDQAGGLAASRMWWMLNNLGIEAYILDGGIQCYLATLQKEYVARTQTHVPPEHFLSFNNILTKTLPLPSEELIAAWPYRKKWSHIALSDEITKTYLPSNEICTSSNLLRTDRPLYVDGRFALRYNSTCRSYAGDRLAGHVPNSINLPWNANLEIPLHPPIAPSASNPSPPPPKPCNYAVLRPYCDLRAKYFDLIPKGKGNHDDSIFSCASGVTACMNIAVCTHLGLGTPRLYPGAWSEFESLNKEYFIQQAHKANGFRLDMIKKAGLVGAVRADSNQLKLTPAPNNSRTSPKALEELKRKVSECLFVGEVADIYQLENGKEVLIGRVEVVNSTLHPSSSAKHSKL